MRLMIKIVVAAALVGAVTSCKNIPFLGRNQTSNQVEASPKATQGQSAKQKQRLGAKQPARAQNNNQTAAQPADVTIDPEAPGNTQSVPALW
jgi:hypothetical protein